MSDPGAELHKLIGNGGGAGEARIDHDHLGIALALGFHRPFETARVVLRRIAAHDQHHVGVLDVDPAICHRTATECGPQTGDRRSVSNTGLVFQVADPQAAHGLDHQVIELVGIGAAAGPGDALAAVDGVALGVRVDEGFIAGLLHQPPDLVDGGVPGDVLPMVGAGTAHLRLEQAPVVDDVLLEGDCPWDRECRD